MNRIARIVVLFIAHSLQCASLSLQKVTWNCYSDDIVETFLHFHCINPLTIPYRLILKKCTERNLNSVSSLLLYVILKTRKQREKIKLSLVLLHKYLNKMFQSYYSDIHYRFILSNEYARQIWIF